MNENIGNKLSLYVFAAAILEFWVVALHKLGEKVEGGRVPKFQFAACGD